MLIFANITIWTMPFPTILAFFNSFQKEFTHNFRSGTFHHFKLFLTQKFVKVIFWKLTHFFASNSVHNQLSSLIDIQIDFFSSIECKIMWVNTFLSFLTKTLLEIWTDFVGWIIIIGIIAILPTKSFSIGIQGIEKSSLLLFGFSLFLFFVILGFKHLRWLALIFDSIRDTFDVTKIER